MIFAMFFWLPQHDGEAAMQPTSRLNIRRGAERGTTSASAVRKIMSGSERAGSRQEDGSRRKRSQPRTGSREQEQKSALPVTALSEAARLLRLRRTGCCRSYCTVGGRGVATLPPPPACLARCLPPPSQHPGQEWPAQSRIYAL